ncbi:phosphate ABC transporter permease PstA [Herbiconiux flava]|uniref:Phosphate transport system permease protein PstA n=1 Tax=Herbiconiux flava TaxID=881268 RepID=A0A852SNM6_9MICO|nr:phosphate ABC transporter permease PstA [Herbiconiux flava]NYD70404.1 phosphate transport system permease protein [Herbiconiux flava]GLK17160.1 phosphate transport system permease protein PstA [Herbiconiux flava]
MTTTTTPPTRQAEPIANSLTTGILPKYVPWLLLVTSWVIVGSVFVILMAAGVNENFNVVGAVFFGTALWVLVNYIVSRAYEGPRPAMNRFVTSLVTLAFVIALLPLISLLFTVISNGIPRFDLPFFSESMRNVVGEGGGALHAIVGTLEITGMATLISVPVGLLTAIYLVEYGRGHLARSITFLVDVMTGIPSIVAGLFAFAFFALILNQPGIRFGFGGAVALSVLMIPVVVRSSEEMLKLVPNELREAAYALGVPKWLTIVKVVLPTSIAGITTGVMLAISRVIGETAPLLIIAGFTQSMNYNLFNERMMTLPVFVYTQYANQGTDAQAYLDRAWAGALTLVVIVMALNLVARIVAKVFSPKLGR